MDKGGGRGSWGHPVPRTPLPVPPPSPSPCQAPTPAPRAQGMVLPGSMPAGAKGCSDARPGSTVPPFSPSPKLSYMSPGITGGLSPSGGPPSQCQVSLVPCPPPSCPRCCPSPAVPGPVGCTRRPDPADEGLPGPSGVPHPPAVVGGAFPWLPRGCRLPPIQQPPAREPAGLEMLYI